MFKRKSCYGITRYCDNRKCKNYEVEIFYPEKDTKKLVRSIMNIAKIRTETEPHDKTKKCAN